MTNPAFRAGSLAVLANTIFNRHGASDIPAQRGVDDKLIRSHMAVDDGGIFFFHLPVFPDSSEFTGGRGVFGDEHQAAGFAIQAIDQMGRRFHSKMQTEAPNKAGIGAGLGGMTNQSGRLVDHQEVAIFVNDLK